MKRLLTITALVLLTMTTGVASAAVLKPLAAGDAWDSSPIFTAAPPGDSRVFVVEQGNVATHSAEIRIFERGALDPTPFLTVPNVNPSGERGLLSMAFPPDYETSGLFYVFQVANGPGDAVDPTGANGDIRIVEYERSASNPDVADPASGRLVLKTAHSAPNHNGGWMAFGPDRHLYFTIGDNANGANAQDLGNLFGKVSRIDPAGAGPGDYAIPADNPFVSAPGARGEIYTYGLRNPFRASFAPDGRLVIGDVGQNATEEVDVGDLAGKNMGWPGCEGFCAPPDPQFIEPFFTYGHDYDNASPAPGTGNVIIGGHVIRDPALTGLTGRYIYGDNHREDLRTLNLSVPGGDPVDPGLGVDQYSLLSFGEDGRGCSYVMANGTASRIAAGAAASATCPNEVVVPDPPDPPVDSTAPGLSLLRKSKYLGKRISFYATCSEKCTISGKGTLKAKRRGRRKAVRFRLKDVSREAEAGQMVKVVLRLRPRALKNARKVARRGRKLRAVFFATAADPSDNRSSGKLTVKVRRKASKR